jgi:hypothetical protein
MLSSRPDQVKQHRVRPITVTLAAVATTAVSFTAAAQPDAAQKMLATKLFNDGRALMAAGRMIEACAKLEESEHLDPAPGTLLNLAVCHESIGRTATAWAEFCDARVAAQRDGRADRVALAERHARALEAKLSRLAITVSQLAEVPQLEVRRDGVSLAREAWGTPLPVDPGEHLIEASAPGRAVRRVRVRVEADGGTRTVALAPLEVEAGIVPATTPATTAATTTALRQARPSGRAAAVALAGGGLLAIGVASFAGWVAITDRRESDAECPFGHCSARGVALNNSATRAADISTVGFAVGLASLAAAGYLALMARRPTGGATRPLVPVPVPTETAGGGVALAIAGWF